MGTKMFRRTVFNTATTPKKQAPRIKTRMRERGIVQGWLVSVRHDKRPWSSRSSSVGKIIQVTDHFFVVEQFPPVGYCECFLFVDVINHTIQVKQIQK